MADFNEMNANPAPGHNFRSTKPRPAWMSAAAQVESSTGYPSSALTPNNVTTSPVFNDSSEGSAVQKIYDSAASNSMQQIQAYGNAKRGSASKLPAPSDAIVDLPESEKKKR